MKEFGHNNGCVIPCIVSVASMVVLFDVKVTLMPIPVTFDSLLKVEEVEGKKIPLLAVVEVVTGVGFGQLSSVAGWYSTLVRFRPDSNCSMHATVFTSATALRFAIKIPCPKTTWTTKRVRLKSS